MFAAQPSADLAAGQSPRALSTTCTACGEDKQAAAFGFRDKASGRRHRRCKRCVAAYGRQHYARNRQVYISRSARNSRARRQALKNRIWRYLAERACVDCGERDPIVLDFDHVETSRKRAEIYWLVRRTCTWSTIAEEIAKCEVRCANCHRRRTAVQFSWPVPHEFNVSVQSAGRLRLRRQSAPAPAAIGPRPPDVPAGQGWCGTCGRVKSLEHFHPTNRYTCAECFRSYRQAHYRLNRRAYIERNTRLLRVRRRRWLVRLWHYLTTHPCVDCGLGDPRVLEFDHRDPEAKLESVSVMAHRGSAWAKIQDEMAKCDVRCAN